MGQPDGEGGVKFSILKEALLHALTILLEFKFVIDPICCAFNPPLENSKMDNIQIIFFMEYMIIPFLTLWRRNIMTL